MSNSKPKPIAGVLPILHTPFLDDGRIDDQTFRREIDFAYEQGADGVCTAMVSEILRLSVDERLHLNDLLVQANAGRGFAIASVGAESTRQAVAFAKAADSQGVDAVMAIPPVTTALPERALESYFGAICESVDVPLIIQDASGYVGQAMSIDFQASMMHRFGADKILFKPEASPIGPSLSALRDATDGQARIFEGSGGILLIDSYRRGIAGTMPGTDVLDANVAVWRALETGDDEKAYRCYFPVCALIAIQMQAGLDGFLAIEKYILKKKGVFPNDLRREPYTWSLDPETAQEIDRLLLQIEKALAA